MSDADLKNWDADTIYAAPELLPFDPDQSVKAVMGQLGDVAYVSHQFDPDEQRRIARLISAAPDLLAACKALVDSHAHDGGSNGCAQCAAVRTARAAIAKAEPTP